MAAQWYPLLSFFSSGLYGLWYKVTNPNKRVYAYSNMVNYWAAKENFSNFSSQWPQSASALRWDLPPALYVVKWDTEVTGLVLQPKIEVECAYPVNGNSEFRRDVQDRKDLCGRTTNPAAGREATNMSGACNLTSPKDYAQAYFNIPQRHLLGFPGFWNLNWATCHFGTVPEALEAQKALWQLATELPPATTAPQWLRNASKVGFALTAFNEIVVAPVHSTDVRAVFWAHAGPFRDPGASDWKACKLLGPRVGAHSFFRAWAPLETPSKQKKEG